MPNTRVLPLQITPRLQDLFKGGHSQGAVGIGHLISNQSPSEGDIKSCWWQTSRFLSFANWTTDFHLSKYWTSEKGTTCIAWYFPTFRRIGYSLFIILTTSVEGRRLLTIHKGLFDYSRISIGEAVHIHVRTAFPWASSKAIDFCTTFSAFLFLFSSSGGANLLPDTHSVWIHWEKKVGAIADGEVLCCIILFMFESWSNDQH